MLKRLIDTVEEVLHSAISSRKFLLTVAGAATAMANGDTHAAMFIVLAYLGVEGAADYKSR